MSKGIEIYCLVHVLVIYSLGLLNLWDCHSTGLENNVVLFQCLMKWEGTGTYHAITHIWSWTEGLKIQKLLLAFQMILAKTEIICPVIWETIMVYLKITVSIVRQEWQLALLCLFFFCLFFKDRIGMFPGVQ